MLVSNLVYKKASIGISLVVLCIVLIGFQAGAAEWIPIDHGVPPSEPAVFLDEDNADYMVIRWELSGAFVEDISVEGTEYQRYSLKSLMQVYNGAPGDPALPMLAEIIHVPDMMKGSVEVINAEWVDLTTGVVMPKQFPSRYDGSQPLPFVINEDSYTQDDPFPAVHANTNAPQGWGGIAVSSVAVTPMRYFPAETRVQIAKSITVRVNFEPGSHIVVRPKQIGPQMNRLHQVALLNPPQDELHPFDADDNEVVRMLFILKEEALETAQPLIDFHHSTGLRTDVIFSDDLPEDDDEAAGELKDIIRERYEEGVEYIQLIGDPRPGAWDVPMFYWMPRDPGAQDPQSTRSHSDSWYVCLDDPDEFGFDDHLPELAVGRLTYDSADDLDELEIQIAKLTDYLAWEFEDRDDVNWLDRCMLIASDAEEEYLRCKRAIEGFDYELDTPDFITQYGDDRNVRNQTVIDIINDDGVGIVNYRGHGNETAWGSWNTRGEWWRAAQVRQLDNRGKPFILVASACLNARVVRGGDCLLEMFQEESGGSVSAHSSIISSYRLANSFFDEAIFKAFFDEGIHSIGYASNLAGTQMVLNYDIPFNNPNVYSLGRMNMRTYIWLGDPALQYRLGDQVELTVDIPEVILIDTEFIEIAVTDAEDNPVENTRVCVRSEDDEIYQVAVTDENGAARIDFDPGMEEAAELFWTAQHRNAGLVGGNIVVADGFGRIEGRVIDLGNEEAIAEAELRLIPFNVLAVSDVNGNYIFNGIPERENYSITVNAEGYLSLQQDGINVLDDEVTEVDFALAYAELTPSEERINVEMEQGENVETTLTISNTGTGGLSWSSWLTDEYDLDRYELIENTELSIELDDFALNGIVLIGEFYYVTGGNNNGFPNYIYKIDRETGRVEERFEQPEGAGEGIGMHDLATDGEYIYGSANDIIYQINLDGDVIDEIDGPHDINAALTLDEEGNIWSAYNNRSLTKIDLDGNILQEIPNDQAVRGLAWSPVDEEGFSLKMFVRGDNNIPTLYKANPETREVRFERVLPGVEEAETPADGLFITNQYNPPAWSIIGMVKYDILRFMRVWHLHYDSEWISSDPIEGDLPAEEEQEIVISINAEDFEAGTEIIATLGFDNNGRQPLVEIPIRLAVGLSVDSDSESEIPTEFAIVGAYPNPFNASTNIVFNVPSKSYVTGSVYDLQGREVLSVIDANMLAGRHTASVDGNLLSAGVYIVRIDSGGFSSTQKIVLLR